ncbi:alpha/beta hydrolase [Salipiger pallidus]|uniref:Alpha/beta hydrolase n=2 Tax=Salipiger pallidus TaxID=1775170 RepID=A0A8J3EHF4_9RHOB|nr:alpha/beta hydrolase [Salipiger pallidus]
MPSPETSLRPAQQPAPEVPFDPRMMVGRKRRLVQAGSRLMPSLMARILAWRYVCSTVSLDRSKVDARSDVAYVPLTDAYGLLRSSVPKGAAQRRVLLLPGKDGDIRQMARMARALRRDGAEVDAMVLPGHLEKARTPCDFGTLTDAIGHAMDEGGPYDAVVAHCVSASPIPWLLAEGHSAPRVVMLSTPLDLRQLVYVGAQQFGITGACRDAFLYWVNRYGGRHDILRDWRPVARARTEPLLLLHARTDHAAPIADVEELARTWPGARLQVFETSDHNGILSNACAIAEVAAFVRADEEATVALRACSSKG